LRSNPHSNCCKNNTTFEIKFGWVVIVGFAWYIHYASCHQAEGTYLMQIKPILLGSVAGLTLAGAALAADLPVKARPAPAYEALPVFSWTGFYIGVHAGGEFGTNDINVGGTTFSTDSSGAFGGGHIGWNYQFAPMWVFGARLDIDGSGLSGQDVTTGISHSVPWHSDFVGRLGYLITPQTLFYGVGGLAFGELKDSVTVPVVGFVENSNTHTGFVAGIGIEHYLTHNLSVGIEWNHVNLGTNDIVVAGTPFATDKTTFEAVKGIVSFKF
jgi:outer membrane immunogenic protein